MNLILVLALLQAPPVEKHIEEFLAGDETARVKILKEEIYAIRPLQRFRDRHPEKVGALLRDLKLASAWPANPNLDRQWRGSVSAVGTLGPRMVSGLGRFEVSMFLDRVDPEYLKKTIRIQNAHTSLEAAEEICRQTGLDYGFFHNHIVIAMPNRLWPSRRPVPIVDLTAPEKERAKALVDKLGDESIEDRETATRELMKMGPNAIPFLQSQRSRKESGISAQCSAIINALWPRACAFGAPGVARQSLDDAGRALLKQASATGEKKFEFLFEKATLADVVARLGKERSLKCFIGAGLESTLVDVSANTETQFDFLALLTQSLDLDLAIKGDAFIIDRREVIESVVGQSAAAQEPTVEDRIAQFVKGEAGAKEALLKMGAAAIVPLRKARAQGPEKIDPLVYELKKAAAFPAETKAPGLVEVAVSVSFDKIGYREALAYVREITGATLVVAVGDKEHVLADKVSVEGKMNAWETVDSVCRQAGLDFGFFHGAVVVVTPERLWGGGKATPLFGPSGAERQGRTPEEEKLLGRMRELKMDVDFQNQTIGDALSYVREFTGLKVETIGAADKPRFSIQVKGLPLVSVLSLITQSQELDYRLEGSKIVLDTRAEIEKKVAAKK